MYCTCVILIWISHPEILVKHLHKTSQKNKGLARVRMEVSTTLNTPLKTAVVCIEQQYRDVQGSMAVSGKTVYDLKTDRWWKRHRKAWDERKHISETIIKPGSGCKCNSNFVQLMEKVIEFKTWRICSSGPIAISYESYSTVHTGMQMVLTLHIDMQKPFV